MVISKYKCSIKGKKGYRIFRAKTKTNAKKRFKRGKDVKLKNIKCKKLKKFWRR